MLCDLPLRVFLADDSAAIRSRVAALLRAHALDVVGESGTPRGCIAGILASRPHVVVLDVQLEGGTGLQVLQKVRVSAPQVAFVVLSNTAAPAYRKRYLGAGALHFLDKSCDFERLPAVVAEAACAAARLAAFDTPQEHAFSPSLDRPLTPPNHNNLEPMP